MPSVYPQLVFRLEFLPSWLSYFSHTSPCQVVQSDNEGCSQSQMLHLCCFILLSHFSPAPAWGLYLRVQSYINCSDSDPSHRLQFFKNSFSMNHFHGVQSFRNRLFQPWGPCGLHFLLENLLQYGLISTGCSSYQAPGPVWAAASFRAHPPAVPWDPP